MGLFNKLKNALFEEEEIEVRPSSEEKVVIKEDSVPTIKKEVPIKEELPKENERDLFKAENTFKFPDFDEEEFVTSYTPKEPEIKPEPSPVKPKEVETRRVEFDRLSPLGYDGDRKNKNIRKEQSKREKPITTSKTTETKNGFRPSPVISPVYGVLDKNYKKEDIIALEEQEKKKFNVDMARKKAFGTLEEDIEKTMETPTKKFYDSRVKNFDDLLTSSADATIDLKDTTDAVNNRMSRNNRKKGRPYAELSEDDYPVMNNFENRVEQELDYPEENLEVLDKTPKEKDIDEDTLESDLFDLIDSMYDNREEE